MKKILIVLIIFCCFTANAQKFKIDLARDSVISMRKYQRPDSSWRVEIKMYVGISDTINNTKRIDYYVIQEENEFLIDSVINEFIFIIRNEKTAMAIRRDRAQERRLQQKANRDRLNALHRRLIRNENKLNNLLI